MAAVFPETDPLSEWLITLALAMNDLALVHARLDEDQHQPEKAFYWHRLAVSHFTEAALFLHKTADVPEVKAFVESLSDEAQVSYSDCLTVFLECRRGLLGARNKATFHYPKLGPTGPRADRPIRDSLVELGDERGVIRSARIRDARALFADDVVAAIFAREVGGLGRLEGFVARVAEGTTAFIRFANLALDEHLIRLREQGAIVQEVEPVDPGDLRAGWKLRGPA